MLWDRLVQFFEESKKDKVQKLMNCLSSFIDSTSTCALILLKGSICPSPDQRDSSEFSTSPPRRSKKKKSLALDPKVWRFYKLWLLLIRGQVKRRRIRSASYCLSRIASFRTLIEIKKRSSWLKWCRLSSQPASKSSLQSVWALKQSMTSCWEGATKRTRMQAANSKMAKHNPNSHKASPEKIKYSLRLPGIAREWYHSKTSIGEKCLQAMWPGEIQSKIKTM